MVYVAGRHGGAPWWADDAAEQAQISEWLAFAASWVQYGVFTARAVVSFGIPANGLPPDYQENLDGARIRGARSLEILNDHLAHNDWLACGDCNRQYPVVQGIPVMLPEEGDRWQGKTADELPEIDSHDRFVSAAS